MTRQNLVHALLASDAVLGDLVRASVIEHGYVVELVVAAQVINVGVRVDDEDRQVRQRIDHASQIPDPAARVDEGGTLFAQEKTGDRLLEVPGLVDCEEIGCNLVDIEPPVTGR